MNFHYQFANCMKIPNLNCSKLNASDQRISLRKFEIKQRVSLTIVLFADVALNKPALQSSLLAVDALENEQKDEKGNPVVIPGVGPELAVDGNMSTIPSMGSCSMTALEVDPWWRVDLQRELVVTDVNVVSSSGKLLWCHYAL